MKSDQMKDLNQKMNIVYHSISGSTSKKSKKMKIFLLFFYKECSASENCKKVNAKTD